MNYKKIYDNLIYKAQNRVLKNVYFEKHHVIPKYLNGLDEENNIKIRNRIETKKTGLFIG